MMNDPTHRASEPQASADDLAELLWLEHPKPLCLLGERGRVVRVNTAFERHYRYSDWALTGAQLANWVDDALRTRLEPPYSRDAWSAYGRLLDPQGKAQLVYVEAKPSTVNGCAGLLLVVSPQSQPSFLKGTQLTQVLASLDEVIWSLSAHTHTLLYISPAAERTFGYSARAFYEQPQHFFDIVHPNDRARVDEQFDTLRQGAGAELRYRVYHADGSIRWTETQMQFVFDDQFDDQVRIDGISKDITTQYEAEVALRLNETRYRAVVEQQVEYICRYRPDGILTFVNEAYCSFFGRSPESLVGTNFYALMSPKERLVVKRQNLRVTPDTPTVVHDHKGLLSDQSGHIWHQWVLRGFFDDQGELVEMQSVGRDITRLKDTELALRRSEALLKGVFDSSLDGIIALEAVRDDAEQIVDFTWRELNQSAAQMIGVHADAVRGRRVLHDTQVPTFGLFTRLVQVVETGQSFDIETHLTSYEHWFRVVAVKFDDGLAITFSDITERKHQEEELARLAYYDSLTGLGNRRRLEERAAWIQRDPDARSAVVYIDLDRFKRVNDSYGHKVGDALLIAVAKRLRESLRENDMVVRLGGDEFAVLLSHDDEALVDATCYRLTAALERPFNIDGHPLEIGASLGYARYPHDGHDLDTLLNRADKAMYQDKYTRRQA